MTVQRQVSPLPDGRYWISIFGDNRQPFNDWRTDNKDSVKVETTTDVDSDPPESFFIFNVKSNVKVPGGTSTIFIPVNFDAAKFGFPNFAPPSIKSREDTRKAPDLPPDPSTTLGDMFGSRGFLGGLESGLKIAGYGIAGWLVWKLFTRGNPKS